jgi:hypothetical protein
MQTYRAMLIGLIVTCYVAKISFLHYIPPNPRAFQPVNLNRHVITAGIKYGLSGLWTMRVAVDQHLGNLSPSSSAALLRASPDSLAAF